MIGLRNGFIVAALVYLILFAVPPFGPQMSAVPPPERRPAQQDPAAPLIDWRLAEAEGNIKALEEKLIAVGIEMRTTRDELKVRNTILDEREKSRKEDVESQRFLTGLAVMLLAGILAAKATEMFRKRDGQRVSLK